MEKCVLLLKGGMMTVRKTIFFLMLLLCISSYSDALALSCAEPRTIQDEYAYSEIVFRGLAEEVDGAHITFRLLESWKGPTPVVMNLMVSNMWMDIVQGEQYLVYATNHSEYGLSANICGRTGLWEQTREDTDHFPNAGEVLVEERELELTSELVRKTPQLDILKITLWVLAVMIILSVALLVNFLLSKRRRS